MDNFISFGGSSIRFRAEGEGVTLIFLHGYLESLEIWDSFIPDLVRDYRVLTMDLPGHGQSGVPSAGAGMEVMAAAASSVLDHLGIASAIWIGHSMGGYASLAQLESDPSRMKGICLFHSHTLADSPLVIEKRKREIHIVEQGQKRLLVMQNIPNMFAPQNLVAFEKELELTRSIARETSDEGVIAALEGLMNRRDRSSILSEAGIPCYQIVGRHDQYIAFKEVSLATRLPQNSQRLILEHSGHMGFFEEKARCLHGIRQFVSELA